ncbi:MAG TPA: hypothetical protein VHT30_08935 [Acidimicrobiales bacterium]|jgi:hypothetical protein|nr:hypothetical protein [Acidimicrobiales bacterium]
MWTQIPPFSQAEHAYRRQQIMAGFGRRPRHHSDLQAVAAGWRDRRHGERHLVGRRPVPHLTRAA